MSTFEPTYDAPRRGGRFTTAFATGGLTRTLTAARRLPEAGILIALAALLNLWGLGRNGWANTYYSAAVRSMSTSWHNFLYASLDRTGVMTVDKPPLALWVQALSVRVFGYHPLAILVPQALMGVVAVVLVYDLVRRRFGRAGGFVAGLVLATTPISVAVARHNNPDELLVLCVIAALWFAVRAFESGCLRHLVLCGVCVGLGFETKMGVALVVVAPIAIAWIWVAKRGRIRALRQLLAGGGAMLLVGGAWPVLVALTPAADRPWISGTSDNSIFSLIFGYNGLGRVDGQAGGPGALGGGGSVFGGATGPTRLLASALGGQASWLLGVALVGIVALAVSTRGNRSDPRTGWLIMLGGSLLVTAVLFSAASGIFHPYYVSLLAPMIAALVGATWGSLWRGELPMRIVAPAAIAAGVIAQLVVLGDYPGQLDWLRPTLVVGAAAAIVAVIFVRAPRIRAATIAAAAGLLVIAPAVWASDTLAYKTSGTFPAGGPQSVSAAGFGGGGAGRIALRAGLALPGVPGGAGRNGAVPPAIRRFFSGSPAGGPPGGAPGFPGGAARQRFARTGLPGGGPGGGDSSLTGVIAYVRAHGGGTIAVSSQGSAANAIISGNASVAGIGGFSGRESDPSVAWLAAEVRGGRIRWVLASASGPTLGRDRRAGASVALAAAARACRAVSVPATSTHAASTGTATTIYDCAGRAAAIAAA